MRLIDADELINEMKKWYWDSEKQRAAELDNSPMDLFTNLAITTVKDQPTAYDIDKVVEELENYKSQYEKISLSINDDTERRIYVAKEATMYNAIEIVKQGVR